ncbi:MAG TPA: phosphatidylserine decarboxylase family protein [Syntrophobacter fumaroxidans]|nr:phosphatidylserine decarboxylase family protein [Syntrophobacter fumaroxidans]
MCEGAAVAVDLGSPGGRIDHCGPAGEGWNTHLDRTDFRQKSAHIPVAREGVPFIVAGMFVTFVAAILGCSFLALVLTAVTLLVGHFFRDPERVAMAGDRELVSCADGKVIAIDRVESARFIPGPRLRISIFMSVFDVHVNRIPYSGIVRGVYYQKGRFLAANRAAAGRENEQNWLWIRTDEGVDIVLTQVAGLIARRIVCWPGADDNVVRGERFGMIRFGSRMDVYVPEDSELLVSRGQHVYGGETALCRLK